VFLLFAPLFIALPLASGTHKLCLTDQIIEELVNDKRIDPRLIRALSRI